MLGRKTITRFLAVALLAGILGCAGYPLERSWPEPRPLGREYPAFQAPALPTLPPAGALPAEPTGALALRDALALALLKNPELAAFSWEVRAAEAAALQASLPPNPELGLEVENVAGTRELRGFRSAEVTLSLGQAIELGGKRAKRTRAAALKAELAGWDYEAKRLDVLTETAKAFIEVLAGQEQAALDEELVRLAEQTHKVASERVKAGKVSPIEEVRTRVALTTTRIELEQARRELETLRRRLAAHWGSTSPGFERAGGQLDRTDPTPSPEQLVRLLARNPDVARWAIEMAQRRATVAVEESKRVPDLTVSGGVRRFRETEDTAFVAGISIPVPLFDRNQGGLREARFGLAKAAEERRAAEVRAHTALAEAYQTLASALAQSAALKNDALPGAQAAFDAARAGYEQGKLTYLDVLDAQRTLFEARGQYIKALAAYHKAAADTERLIGQSLTGLMAPVSGPKSEVTPEPK